MKRYPALIDPATLAARLGDPRWVVADCRFTLSNTEAGRRAYLAGHIPGARYAHLDDDLSSPVTPTSGRHPLPDPQGLANRLGTWGIDADTQVVVYDDSFGSMAARLWWLLRWLGHGAVALLDGGLPRWKREGHPLDTDTPDTDTPQVTARQFVARPNPALITDTNAVAAALGRGGCLLIDARAEERFQGLFEPIDKVAGHIPGAINMPLEDNLDVSGDFLPEAELRERFLPVLGGRSPDQIIHTCGSGVTACHNVLAMEAAGLTGSRLYVGSWSEWITDPSRPIATGEK